MKTAIVTVCIGDKFQELGNLTHPSMKAYANKTGSDFLVINEDKYPSNLGFNKIQMADILDEYDRIVYLDSDVLVRSDCPNLFEKYKEGTLAMLDESPFLSYDNSLYSMAKHYGIDIIDEIEDLPSYYNVGVMLFDKSHIEIFKRPEILEYVDYVNGKFTWFEEGKDFTEQTYFNLMIRQFKIKVTPLSFRYNRMELMDYYTKEHRYNSYIIHYAGFQDFNKLLNVAKKDSEELLNKAWLRNEYCMLVDLSKKPTEPLSTSEWIWKWGE